MSTPSDPPFLANIRDRLRRYREAVVCVVTAQSTANFDAAKRLIDSDELFSYVADGLSDLMRQFVADCRSSGVRQDAAAEAAVAVQDCTRQLHGLLARFPTVHTQEGRASLLKVWRKSYGKDDRPVGDDLYWLSMDLNHRGEGGRETIQDAADRINRPANEQLDGIRNATSTTTATVVTFVPVESVPDVFDEISFPRPGVISYDGLDYDAGQRAADVLRTFLKIRGGKDVDVLEFDVLEVLNLSVSSTRNPRTAIRAALADLSYPRRLVQIARKSDGKILLRFEGIPAQE